MTVGLSVYNDSNTIQLDDNRPTLVYRAKGTHSTTTGASTAPVGSRSVLTLNGVTSKALVALRPSISSAGGTKFAIYQFSFSDSTLTLNIFCSVATTQTVDWYLFDAPSNADAGNFGLEVFDENGARTYHSFAKPIKVVNFINRNTTNAADNVAYDDNGLTLAYAQGALAGYRSWDRGANGNVNKYWEQSRWSGVGRSDTGLVIGNALMDRNTAVIRDDPLDPSVFNPQNFLLIDVSGY